MNSSKYWRKYESNRILYYDLSKKPDYINKELFFKILNGFIPKPDKG